MSYVAEHYRLAVQWERHPMFENLLQKFYVFVRSARSNGSKVSVQSHFAKRRIACSHFHKLFELDPT